MIDISKVPSACFVLEERLLRKNLELLHSVQARTTVQIILALKGFAMYSTFPFVRKYLAGATASSLNEARLIFEEMGCKAHTYSPLYLDSDMPEILQYSSHMTFNSWNQYERFRDRATAYHEKISMGIRINPQYSEVETDLYNPCVPGSRLGVVRAQMPDKLPAEIEGLHFHTLCENDSYTLERTLKAVEERFSDLLYQVKWFNMGGGHLMTRKGYDIDHLVKVLNDFQDKYPHLQLIMEPGSAIGWQTGYLVATVLDIVNNGMDLAILDTSAEAHMPDTLAMPYRAMIRNSAVAFEKKALSNFALLKSTSLALTQFIMAEIKLAPTKVALFKFTPIRLAPFKLASFRLTPSRLAYSKLAYFKSIPLRSKPCKSAFLKSAP